MSSLPSQQIHPSTLWLLALAALLAGPLACGDDTAAGDTGTATATATTATTTATTAATATQGSGSVSESDSTASGSGSSSGSTATDSASSSSSGSTATDSATSAGTTDTSGQVTVTEGTTATSTGATTDATTGDATTGGNCDAKCGNSEWSYIWIANSGENTVSKIDTRTLKEESRFRTRPDGSGSPSRTSVSIDGRAVAIANRFGGLTKIWARKEDCTDKNNNGVIDTSTGKDDVRPFDNDECIAWHNPFSDFTVQRPVAWTSGVYNLETCQYDDQKIWTATAKFGTQQGQCGVDGIWVHRVNGDTGAIEDTVQIPQNILSCTFGNSDWGFGAYGAAVDPDNNLWFYVFGQGKIARVDHDTLQYEVFGGGSYGITVDTQGRVWDDVPRRFDYQTKTWSNPIGNIPGNGGSGVAEDLQGRIWKATTGGVGWVDADTMQVGDIVTLPGNYLYRGIAVDIDGYIWAIQLGGNSAYKIHPDTYATEHYDLLNAPYTYSDMAGGQINKVICPQ